MTLAARVQSSSRSASPYSARPVHRGSACWAYAPERDAEPVLLRAGVGGLRYRAWGVVQS